MKIKRLDIVGFKSFVDKVSLSFEHGITGVVGPNGCGKSNVVDAIRWVMGEQNPRNLRGRMMEDVIFGGSESRKPQGLAQVSIIFDNRAGICPAAYKNFAEIMVTRRLYRSGESEYLINKTPCRLLDITELFMDTGVGARAYSIIEQGKVGMLVSAKPEERRTLIEEAAGVTKFKLRKKSALRKMDATRQNLVRLGDVVAEVRRQIGSLKRQAQRAERYRDYRSEMKQLELSLSGNKFQQLVAEITTVIEHEAEQATILARLDGRLEDDDLRLEEQQLLLVAAEKEHSQAQEQVYHLSSEVQRIENERILVTRQQEHLNLQNKENVAEQEDRDRRTNELQAELLQLGQGDLAGKSQLEILNCEVANSETALQARLLQEQQLNVQVETARKELMELFAQNSRLATRGVEIDRQLVVEVDRRQVLVSDAATIEQQQQQLQQQQQQLRVKLEQVKDQQDQLVERSECLEEQLLGQKKSLFGRETAQRTLRQQLEKNQVLHGSLADLQRNLEGYGDGTRALLSADADAQIMVDLVKVAAEHEVAVEMALGNRLQAVPLSLLAGASANIQLLTEQQFRGTMLLPCEQSESFNFVAGVPLLDLVTPVAGAEAKVVQLLLGVFLVDDVAPYFQQQLPIGVTLVDRHGTCFDWRGVLEGGATINSSVGLLHRQRQLDEMSITIDQQEQQLTSAQADLEQAQEAVLVLEEEKAVATSTGHRLELQALEIAKDRQGLQAEVDHLNKRQALLVTDLQQIDSDKDALIAEKEQLAAGNQQAEAQRQQVEVQLQQRQDELAELRSGTEGLREAVTKQRVALAALEQQQHARQETLQRIEAQQREILQRQSQLRQRQQAAADTLKHLDEKDQRLQVELEILLSRRDEQQLTNVKIRDRYEQQRTEMEELRGQFHRVRAEAEEMRKLVTKLQLRQHELKVDAEAVRQNVLERYRVDLQEHRVPEATEDELGRQQQQYQRLQQKVEVLGEVNLMAIKEYQEQEERYDFLSRQRDDLNRSLDDLQKAINQINRTTRRLFKETFTLVNDKFKEIFPRMFVGGQAELRLTDEENLLETGVEIVAQPPGKRLQSVNLLSGGEKAFTAVALIFSLFLIKPTPFCILDEVDAPLDDANIDRFADIIQEMTAQSQFIIITHSKRTMGIVDTMYGVTMQEPGVSKLVSVRINDYKKS